MIGELKLVCVCEVETDFGNEYLAQVQCRKREDGKTLLARIHDREAASGIELLGYEFREVCYPGVGNATINRRDLFITLQYNADIIAGFELRQITTELQMLIC